MKRAPIIVAAAALLFVVAVLRAMGLTVVREDDARMWGPVPLDAGCGP